MLPEHGPRVRADGGDVLICRGPDAYVMADDPATPPAVAIGPDQQCRPLRTGGRERAESLGCPVRPWGNADPGTTVMLTGTYRMRGEVSQRLLRALPPLVHLDADAWDSPLIALLADEIVKDQPGQEAVLDRLLDLLLIAALRAWFARPDAEPPRWYRASGDPIVGHVLRLIHHHPARAWTVADLAREVGISRTALARRFHQLVGEPPMAFLTNWRIALAADLLLEPDTTIASVATKSATQPVRAFHRLQAPARHLAPATSSRRSRHRLAPR